MSTQSPTPARRSGVSIFGGRTEQNRKAARRIGFPPPFPNLLRHDIRTGTSLTPLSSIWIKGQARIFQRHYKSLFCSAFK